MPLQQRTVYFRPEDIELWNRIDNKALWLHEHLRAPIYNTKPTREGNVIVVPFLSSSPSRSTGSAVPKDQQTSTIIEPAYEPVES